MPYLFVHFKEKRTPDGEQVYFGLSRDGLKWEAVNGGQPVIWSMKGEKGVRDMTIIRDRITGRFHMFATDLSLSYNFRTEYKGSWKEVSARGSKSLCYWHSDDLITWSEQELVFMDDKFGCCWAPDVLYDPATDDYLLHWSSSTAEDEYRTKKIWGCRTKDFVSFTEPEPVFSRSEGLVIDSAVYCEDGIYYMFIKSEREPSGIMLYTARGMKGPWERNTAFEDSIKDLAEGLYEAPTALKLPDGRWALFLDFYGVKGAGQGYVPFVTDDLREGRFTRVDSEFSFPYRFKHGTVVEITDEEYERVKSHNWEE